MISLRDDKSKRAKSKENVARTIAFIGQSYAWASPERVARLTEPQLYGYEIHASLTLKLTAYYISQSLRASMFGGKS